MASMSIEYGTFELLYELPMSALSGGVGLGAGVGRGRGVVRGWLFAVTAPMARMRTVNAALINSVIVFNTFISFIILLRDSRAKFWNFFGNRRLASHIRLHSRPLPVRRTTADRMAARQR